MRAGKLSAAQGLAPPPRTASLGTMLRIAAALCAFALPATALAQDLTPTELAAIDKAVS